MARRNAEQIEADQARLNITEDTIPCDIEAEHAVLGSITIDPDAIDKVIGFLKPNHFFRHTHEILFASACELRKAGIPIDTITLWGKAQEMGLLASEKTLVFDVLANAPTALYIDHYAKVVFTKWQARYGAILSRKHMTYLLQGEHAAARAVLKEMQTVADMEAGDEERDRAITIKEAVGAAINETEAKARGEIEPGIKTGLILLDRMLGGLKKRKHVVIAGRPGMGKSVFGNTILLNASKNGWKALLISLEMSHEENAIRMIAAQSGIDSAKMASTPELITREEWDAIYFAADELSELDMSLQYVYDVDDVCRRVKKYQEEHGLDLLLIDYMQLLGGGEGKDRREKMGSISRKLTKLAFDNNMVVVSLSQLSRASENRADKRPMLSDLRETGDIEQDASVVMTLYREDYYDENSDLANVVEIDVPKHRGGPTGRVQAYFSKPTNIFKNLEVERTELN